MKTVNLIPFIQASYSGWNAKTNHLHSVLLADGWSGFFAELVDPALKWLADNGLPPRVFIWLPYGICEKQVKDASGNLVDDYSLNSYFECKAKKLLTPASLQAERIKRIAAGAQIIDYIGAPTLAPNLSAGAQLNRLMESVIPLLSAGASIAVDASATFQTGSWQAGWAENLRQMMLVTSPLTDRFYVEARPYSTTWTNTAGCICVDEEWETQASWANALSDNDILGEVLRWPQQPNWVDPNDCGWEAPADVVAGRIIKDVNRINAEGHTAIVDLRPIMETGKTLKDFAAV